MLGIRRSHRISGRSLVHRFFSTFRDNNIQGRNRLRHRTGILKTPQYTEHSGRRMVIAERLSAAYYNILTIIIVAIVFFFYLSGET